MSKLFLYEIKKILSGAALWIFIGLCLALNIWTMPRGFRVELDTTTPYPTNVFEGYDTGTIAERYISGLGLTGRTAQRMRAKFDALQTSVDRLALTGDSYSPYFGEHTFNMHQSLFNSFGLVGRLLLQGAILAVLLALLCIGHEQAHHTQHVVYATKTGRRLLRLKIAASLVTGIGLYALLAAVTLALHFSVVDFSNVWGSSVSSGFNFLADFHSGARPFATWQSFTVRSYLWASLGVSLGLVICFSLMGAIVGTFSKNGYVGFLVVLLINALCLVLPMVLPINSYLPFIVLMSPMGLWSNADLWFTDGGFFTLWRNFELWGMGISLLILAALCVFAMKKFETRDIA